MARPIRFHVAIGVSDLKKSRAFYTAVFKVPPTREAVDQIDWILDDPAVNFSLFYNPERPVGPEHFGLDYPAGQVQSESYRLGVKDFAISDPDGTRVEIFSSDKLD